VSHCTCLDFLIVQKGSASVPASFFGRQLFKQLIVPCHKSNPAGEVDPFALVPLPHDLLTCSYASQPLDTERRKVPQDGKLVHMGEWLVFSMSFPLIIFDLFSQLFPSANFVFRFWLGPRGIKHIIDIILLSL
jgi:hypothetical protein